MGYFSYKDGSAIRELGYEGKYNDNYSDSVATTLGAAGYKSSSTYSSCKFVRYDPSRVLYGMLPWGNHPVNNFYKCDYNSHKGINVLSNGDNTPFVVASSSSATSIFMGSSKQVGSQSWYLKYDGSIVTSTYTGSSGSVGTPTKRGYGSIIILAQAQGGGGGAYGSYTHSEWHGNNSIDTKYKYGGGGGGSGAFAAIAMDMTKLKDIFISVEYKSNAGSGNDSDGGAGGDIVIYKGSSTSGTKILTIGGGGGGSSRATGGAGGVVTVHRTYDGFKVIGDSSGSSGGAGDYTIDSGTSSDIESIQGANFSITIDRPMATSNLTMSHTGGKPGCQMGGNAEGYDDYQGGGGGASAFGNGGNGSYASSKSNYYNGTEGGLGAGGGGGGRLINTGLFDFSGDRYMAGGVGGPAEVLLIWG